MCARYWLSHMLWRTVASGRTPPERWKAPKSHHSSRRRFLAVLKMQISKKCDAAQVCKLRRKIALGANAAQGYLVPFPRPGCAPGSDLTHKIPHHFGQCQSEKEKPSVFFRTAPPRRRPGRPAPAWACRRQRPPQLPPGLDGTGLANACRMFSAMIAFHILSESVS